MHFSLAAVALLLSDLTAAASLQRRFTSPSDPARFTAYPTPSKGVICDGDTGVDGETMWYEDLVQPLIGVFNYKTKVFKEYPIPYTNNSMPNPVPGNITGIQCVMRVGKDGMMYAGSGVRNVIVQINPRTDPPVIQIFQPPNNNPLGDLQPFNDFWGGNTAMYFSQTTGNTVMKFDFATHKFTLYNAKTPQSGPLGMRTDKHDNLWYTNFQGQFISKIDALTGAVTEYHNCCPLPFGAFPEVLRSSTMNQKYLWANAFGANGYIRIEPDEPDDSKKFKIFTNPLGAGTFPFENSNDFCGRIWYTSPSLNVLAYYDPHINKWTNVQVPAAIAGNGGTPVTGNFEVIMHRGPGHYMWFSIGTLGKLVRYELDASCRGEVQ